MPIYLDIIIGSPQADCAKFGVCEINLLPPEQYQDFMPKHWRHVKAILCIEGMVAAFYFPFDGMMPATRKAFFPESGFLVEARKNIPAHILCRADYSEPVHIQTGIYAITEAEKGYEIKMQLGTDSGNTEMEAHALLSIVRCQGH